MVTLVADDDEVVVVVDAAVVLVVVESPEFAFPVIAAEFLIEDFVALELAFNRFALVFWPPTFCWLAPVGGVAVKLPLLLLLLILLLLLLLWLLMLFVRRSPGFCWPPLGGVTRIEAGECRLRCEAFSELNGEADCCRWFRGWC